MNNLFECSRKQELEDYIDILRDILNEMCCTLEIDEYIFNIEMLKVSCQLDKVIVEYMILKNS